MRKSKKTLRLKKFNIHPVGTLILLIIGTLFLSWILSILEVQVLYDEINFSTLEVESKLISVENMLNFRGLKFMISNAAKNFAGFAPLSNLLIGLIGLSVAYATGFIDAFTKRITLNINNKMLTFIIILLGTISSLINDVGYTILIPISAIVFSANKRSPILGIIAAYCGVAFGYGTTIFVGSMEVSLIPDTTAAARLIDSLYHIELTSNLIIMIVTTFITSIVGTFVVEKIIAPKVSGYKTKEADYATKEINITEIKETEQNKLEIDAKERRGLRKSFIVAIIFLLCFIYMLIPSLPFSGLLLDLNAKTYLKQAFGANSYFQDGFTYMISLFFIVVGLVYGFYAKTIKNDKDLVSKITAYFNNIGSLIVLLFFASQFIAIFKKTNIGTVIVALSTKLISQLSFSGIPLIICVLLLIGVCNLFVTTPIGKWGILAPVVVPLMMKSNISPQFSQFIFRGGDSLTKGITPLLAYFAIYVGYLNMYNTDKGSISIKKAISYIMPYCIIITVTWILIIVGWYVLGAPIGIGVSPTL